MVTLALLFFGPTVTESNTKEVQKQENKSIRFVGMALQRVCKQGRDDIKGEGEYAPITTSLPCCILFGVPSILVSTFLIFLLIYGLKNVEAKAAKVSTPCSHSSAATGHTG